MFELTGHKAAKNLDDEKEFAKIDVCFLSCLVKFFAYLLLLREGLFCHIFKTYKY